MQSYILLAQLQCIVARGKACALIPDIEIIRETETGVVFLRAAADVGVVGLDSGHQCILLRGISAAFASAAFAVNFCLLKVVRP